MQSHGRAECFARSVISEILPFESGAMMNCFFSRVSPATVSGHGLNRCHARFKFSFSAPVSPVKLKSARIRSSDIRCSASSLVHGSSPVRTRFMLGPYAARQASANFAASTATPFRFARSCTSAVTEVRQSTTVPKTSKTSAFTRDSSRFSRFGCPPLCACADAAAIITAPACRKSRRDTSFILITNQLPGYPILFPVVERRLSLRETRPVHESRPALLIELCLCLLNMRRIGKQIRRRQRHRFRGHHHALDADRAAGTGGRLPAVRRHAGHEGRAGHRHGR